MEVNTLLACPDAIINCITTVQAHSAEYFTVRTKVHSYAVKLLEEAGMLCSLRWLAQELYELAMTTRH